MEWKVVSQLMVHFSLQVFSSLPDEDVLEMFVEPILNCWWATTNWKLQRGISLWYWNAISLSSINMPDSLSWLIWGLFKRTFYSHLHPCQSSGHCLFECYTSKICKINLFKQIAFSWDIAVIGNFKLLTFSDL